MTLIGFGLPIAASLLALLGQPSPQQDAGPAPARPSSMRLGNCDYEEELDFVWGEPLRQTGDRRCHRRCHDQQCGPHERCEARLVYLSDTPSRHLNLCLCEKGARCPERGDGGLPRPAEGGLGLWQRRTAMPVDLYYHAAAADATTGWLFVSGGLSVAQTSPGGASLRRVRDVSVARIGADGRLGRWKRAGRLMESVVQHAMAVWRGRLYVAGGAAETSRLVERVWSARINVDGSLGAWRAEAPLPSPRAWHRLVAAHGQLIVAGGAVERNQFSLGTAAIWTATPDAAGVIGSWKETQAPAAVFFDGAAGIAGERLYVLGEDGGLRSAALPGLVDWRNENTWRLYKPVLAAPTPTDPNMGPVHLFALREVMVAVIAGGNALTAPLDATGTIGHWRIASRFYGVDSAFAVASTDRALFALGGVAHRLPVQRHREVWSTRLE